MKTIATTTLVCVTCFEEYTLATPKPIDTELWLKCTNCKNTIKLNEGIQNTILEDNIKTIREGLDRLEIVYGGTRS